MNDILLWLLGKSDVTAPKGGRVDLVWLHRPQSWMVFLSIAAVASLLYASWRWYSRENDACPRALKRMLALLRLTALVVLVVILLGPALVISLEKIVEPWVFVVIDESSSMAIKDRFPEDKDATRAANALETTPAKLRANPRSRAEMVSELLLREDQAFVKELSTKGKLRIFTFSDKATLRQTIGMTRPDELQDEFLPKGKPVPPLDPRGPSTNISRGMREALRSVSGGKTAAVVLITDGRNSAGDDPTEYAKELREAGVPVYAIGIGDPSQPKNLRVADLWMPESTFRGDPVKISATIDTRGYDNESVDVEFLQAPIDREGKEQGTVISTKTVSLTGQPQEVSFDYKPDKAGKFVLTARVKVKPNELLDTDNLRSGIIQVSDEKMRVLLVSGGPNWDYRLTKNLLLRDKTIDLSCWLQSMDSTMLQEGDTPIKNLPGTAKELMEYDVVLFLDPDPAEFTTEWITVLKSFVETHAGGLLWMAGPQYSTTFLTHPRTRSVRDLLPVTFGNVEASLLETLGSGNVKSWPARLRAESVDHPIFQGFGVKAGEWHSVPGIYWSYPATAAKPGALCLLEHGNPRLKRDDAFRPLVVAGQYGAGRVMYLGTNATWRWRRTSEEVYDRFWIQSVRYLIEGKQAAGQRQGRLLTDAERYGTGDRIAVSATLYDDRYQPLKSDGFTATLYHDDQKVDEVRMKPISGRDGAYEGSAIAKNLGINEIKLSVTEGVANPIQLSRRFTVELPNVEFADPRMNRPLLKDVAERSGGQYFDVDQLAEVPSKIRNERQVTIVRERPIMLWDTYRIIGFLIVILSIEWAVRRRFRLL